MCENRVRYVPRCDAVCLFADWSRLHPLNLVSRGRAEIAVADSGRKSCLTQASRQFLGGKNRPVPAPCAAESDVDITLPLCRSEGHTSELQSLMRNSYAVVG